MKMNLFDKFLLALLLIALLLLSLLMGGIALRLVPMSAITMYLDSLTGWWDVNGLILGGIALLLFIIVARLLVASYSGDKSQSYTRLSLTETGEIAISIQTIKQITSAFMSTKPEIAATSPSIIPMKQGLIVRLKVCIKEGVSIPGASEAIQKELKAHLETVTGLVIRQIHVEVDNNRSNYSGKGR